MKNIVIIGAPGSGKSTVGKKIAKKLKLNFIDLDIFIGNYYSSSISLLINKYGEFAFRRCESEMLQLALTNENCIISTGGGTPCFENNMDLILQKGYSVYIKMSKISLINRLVNSKKKRPLIENQNVEAISEYVDKIMAKREPFYQKANLIVKGENINIENLSSTILHALEK